MNKIGYVVFLYLLSTNLLCGQDNHIVHSSEDEFGEIGCFQRPKFLEISYRTLPAINAYPNEYLNGDEDFDANSLFEAKLSIPIFLKPKFKLITQLRYKREVLNLGENEYYDRNIHLNNSGILFAYQWHYYENFFIAGHFTSAFKTDKYEFQRYSSILDYNSSVLWGFDYVKSKIAMGVILGNSLGRFNVVPMFVFEAQLNPRWRLDMRLPKEVRITRSMIPDNFYLYGSIAAAGASYYLNDDLLEEHSGLEFRRRAVELQLGAEKVLSDWLWLGVELGITQPINSILVESGKASRHRVHDFNQQFTPFANFSVFMVPPRKLYNKLSK